MPSYLFFTEPRQQHLLHNDIDAKPLEVQLDTVATHGTETLSELEMFRLYTGLTETK
jgi:hypothetical protein